MAPLDILKFPDPRLRTVAKPVKEVTGKIVALADQMLDAMYEAPGIGLAATQVNFHQRLIVIDISETNNQPLILINPTIVSGEGEIETNEGCLSVPGFYEPVDRYQQIQFEAIGRDGEPFSMEAVDLLAVCIQHEIDHLEGKLFVDYLSSTKRQLIRKKLQKLQKQRA
ncbi:MAG: peptide deformylase [Gammaproteobacteria bacterium]|jgi:peptide deformylase|nr:peptide deformylase [Gammaproteobacteria bacterium]MDG1231725.1 peptide deformylase [Pseudomonadales bacterium]MBT4615789.1 peptide deformylase [Gammaproteobacteria bacterium]MBT5725733.1 peptide deformylase [Gammaproteobacteria bacterium]MBT6584671.1 peptide deformylase [Gammaproteobacteria bacterium]